MNPNVDLVITDMLLAMHGASPRWLKLETPPRHSQGLIYVKSGRAEYRFTDGRRFEVGAGDLFFLHKSSRYQGRQLGEETYTFVYADFETAHPGDLSALGWGSISVLCPLGALGTMLASKTMVPHAVISLVIALVAIVLLGRAFCGWICPVPVVSKLRGAFSRPGKAGKGKDAAAAAAPAPAVELTEKEKALLKSACKSHGCAGAAAPNNSRNLVLGSALLSAAIFGFPVFCLVCPIGLTFALVFVLIALFGSANGAAISARFPR